MAKRSQRADDGTDPAISSPETTSVGPAPTGDLDDEIEEISPDELGAGRGGSGDGGLKVVPGRKVTLGAPPPASGPEKTRVASLDDIAPPDPPAPATAEKTMVMQNPTLTPDPADGHEATMIMANPLDAGRPKEVSRGKLVVVAGKEEGQAFDLTDGTRVVGRSREADICLLDIQVSRRHAEVVADRNGVLVKDLGSGNGTLVNGEAITETRLVHGDEVAIGDHVLRFEEDGPVAQALAPVGRKGGLPAPRTAMGMGAAPAAVPSVAAVRRARRSGGGGLDPRKKRLVIIGSAVGGLLLILGVVKLATGSSGSGQPSQQSAPAATAETDFDAGLALFKQAAYEDALAKFEASAQADPNLGKAKEYVKATKREMAAAAAIKRGDGLLADGKFDEARAAYKAVDSASLRYGDAQADLKRVDSAQARKAVEAGQQILDGTDLDQEQLADAASAFNRALAILPDDTDAKTGLDQVAQKRQDLQHAQAMTAAQRRELARRHRAEALARHKAAIRRALAAGIGQFNRGDFHQAVTTFQNLANTASDRTVRRLASRKVRAIRRFLPAYNKGMSAPSNRPSPAALSALATAFSQAGAIDSHSPIQDKIQKKLGNLYYLKGRVAYNARRYPDAYDAWSRALHFAPGQSLARKGLSDLKGLAKKLYLQAYIQKSVNRSQAIREWKQVVAMTPASDSYHQKAEQRLQENGAQ